MIDRIRFFGNGKLGLCGGELRDLQDVVVLAGPNGGGKSRYLRRLAAVVEGFSNWRATYERLDQQKSDLHAKRAELLGQPASAQRHRGAPSALDKAARELDKVTRHLEQHTVHRALWYARENRRSSNVIYLHYGLPDTIDFMRNQARKSGIYQAPLVPDEFRTQAVRHAATALGSPDRAGDGFGSILALLDILTRDVAWKSFLGSHPGLDAEYPRADEVRLEVESFNAIASALLGDEIRHTWSREVIVPLHKGRQLDVWAMSSGERVLLAWTFMLNRSGARLANSIVLVDEPELHLHPDVAVKALERVRALVAPQGQLWIATHSVPIVTAFGLHSLYLVENGCIEYASNQPLKVLDRLLGGPDGREHLQCFIGDAGLAATYKYAVEALLPPGVVGASGDDPQEKQFCAALARICSEERDLRILDFGTGKARMARALEAWLLGQVKRPKIDYVGYLPEVFATPDMERDANIAALDGAPSASARFVTELAEFERPKADKFDWVLVSNVLHEIPPTKWLSEIERIESVLAPGGFLILMEDQEIPVGELPGHAAGFIVLSFDEVCTLFDEPSPPGCELLGSDKNGRLTLIAVPRASLAQRSQDALRRTVEQVARRARRQVETLRAARSPQERLHADGRKHAFYAMLFVNASIALDELGGAPRSGK